MKQDYLKNGTWEITTLLQSKEVLKRHFITRGSVGQTPDYWNNNYQDDIYFRNGEPEKSKGYCTDVFFDEAISFINKNKENPFVF